ncbi:MAG TPA: acetoacetate--CoA ligase [Micavibrio sp.]|nr:acetoacetate--CoA ligase [Micavibrio sp.]HIL28895.1 acetoacetate--CoA ligase [Micavibrio sp.]
MTNEQPLWTPTQEFISQTNMAAFMDFVKNKTGQSFDDYNSLWNWSVDNTETFWDMIWDFCGVIGDKGDTILADADKMPGAKFYPNGRVNFAENLLRRRDDAPAIIFRTETGDETTYSFKELYDQVSLWSQALAAEGVGEGDRVAGYLPNMPETIIAMLATASLGAIWSSASPDFGAQGLLDRFGQIEPTVFIAVNGYYYNGKTLDCLPKVKEVAPQLKGLKKTVIIDFLGTGAKEENTVLASEFLSAFTPKDIAFNRVEFNAPLFIMFSSGTTGVPKCIVHGHGGTLLQHLKEHKLQSDVRRDDKVFYFTTCGWMMWNWLVSALASEATVLLYDGSPFYPDGDVLWDFTTKHGCTLFGTSAKYIDAMKNADLRIKDTHDLSAMRTMTSTGSPLVHESFDYVYDAIKSDLHLASISGGTDIVSCFMLGNPLSPVWRGEIQGAGLGMALEAFDDNGKPIPAGAGSGELVCTKPFPCMPVMFWNDEDGSKYKAAYFEDYENIWCHGDWIERTEHGGFIIHGRSDATLNPGGVRIGTAEIYRQVEKIEEVTESMAVGQDWDGDVRVILFVTLRAGTVLDEDLIKRIKTEIRMGASPRHMPAKVIQVTDIPRTKSNKIVELAVRNIIHGRPVKNVEALANPEALELYRDLPDLKS